jgi:hypothetical protein
MKSVFMVPPVTSSPSCKEREIGGEERRTSKRAREQASKMNLRMSHAHRAGGHEAEKHLIEHRSHFDELGRADVGAPREAKIQEQEAPTI